jgi:hypothetical protein
MARFSRLVERVVDVHGHLGSLNEVDALASTVRQLGYTRMNVLCYPTRQRIHGNHVGMVAKARFPQRFCFFGGLDHAAYWSDGRVETPTLAEQVDRLAALGAAGIKVLETKPTSRKELPIPIDDDYFEPFLARAESLGVPLLWHVADPEEFWDPARTPDWAASRGWGYDETDVPKETLYGEVERVLDRHPRLRVILAHFYFLSADLRRADAFLQRHDAACLDLAPGIEMCYNLSADPAASHEFFCRHAERILYGTDIGSGLTPTEARVRAEIVRRWLETDEVFTVPPEADFLLGDASAGRICGMRLPADVLGQIYAANFDRVVPAAAAELDRKAAIDECRRVADELATMTGTPAAQTEPGRAAQMLRAL